MKIDKLTKDQESLLSIYKDKWIKIGLSTEPCNKQLAEECLKRAYKIAGLQEPKQIIWTTSPLAGSILVELLKDDKFIKSILLKAKIKNNIKSVDSIKNSIGDCVGDSIRNSVGNSVRDFIRDSVGVSIRNSVGDSIRDYVAVSIRDSVWNSVRNSVGNSVGNSVRNSVRDSVWNSVRNSVWNSVGDSVGNSIEDSVVDSVNKKNFNNISEAIFGQHDAHWLGYYEYFREVCNLIKETDKLIPLINLSKHSNWSYLYKNIAIISEKPISIKLNENNKLHNLNGPALEYKDGFSIYSINGVRIEEGTDQYKRILHLNSFGKKMDELLK